MFEYLLKPLAAYMAQNQNIGIFIAGLIACAESMAIVGSIIPGSVTMTLVGTMIGSGILDIKLSFSAIIFGAFIGDYLSYWVGYYYRDNIKKFKIIQKNIEWMDYGEKFIKKHGVKSIVIGRFFGPMRSLIPLVAGVLGMRRWKFILGALPSVVLWAVIYLTPGIFIGAFALEMPTNLVFKFIGVFILLIIAIIFISLSVNKLVSFLNKNQTKIAHMIWQRLMKNPGWMTINFFHCDRLGPIQILKLSYALLLSIFSTSILVIIISSTSVNIFDLDVFNLMRNTYSITSYKIFTLVTFLGSKTVIIPSLLLTSLYLVYKNEYRLTRYILCLTGATSVMVELIKYFVMRPRPILSSTFTEPYSFPSGHVALSTAVFCFLILVFCHNIDNYKKSIAYKSVACILFAISFSRLYLCAHWLSDILFALSLGITNALVSSILYHRKPCNIPKKNIIIIFLGSYFCAYGVTVCLNYNNYISSYDPPIFHQRTIKFNNWWGNIKETEVFRDNKFGHHVYPLNIQWLGKKEQIEAFLENNKWQKHESQTTIISRIMHLVDDPSLHIIPLIPQTYNLRTPAIVYSFNKKDKQIVIKLWKSFLNVMPDKRALWIGNIYINNLPEQLFSMPSRYRVEELNTTNFMEQYSNSLDINTINLNSVDDNNNLIPEKIKSSAWDEIIIQLKFKSNSESNKDDKAK